MDISIIAYAFGFGVMAAAPIGPVYTIAIRRGLIGHWTHTLSVSLGSVVVEAGYIALALWGGQSLMSKIDVQWVQRYAGLPAAGIMIVLGIIIMRKAVIPPRQMLAAVRAERMRRRRTGPAGDILTGAVLTLLNPGTFLYWVLVAGPVLLQKAGTPAASSVVWIEFVAASAGIVCWFVLVATIVRLRPQNVGPTFFRLANAICGMSLSIIGIVLAVTAIIRS